ncbi:hypothetical protein [Petrimonas sp.]|uniref:hypothetical protein n=1 Tax=Petrimonas sp. TaxID=2023866 RepID=UPI002FCA0CA2
MEKLTVISSTIALICIIFFIIAMKNSENNKKKGIDTNPSRTRNIFETIMFIILIIAILLFSISQCGGSSHDNYDNWGFVEPRGFE